jgi:hypothetical protein
LERATGFGQRLLNRIARILEFAASELQPDARSRQLGQSSIVDVHVNPLTFPKGASVGQRDGGLNGERLDHCLLGVA